MVKHRKALDWIPMAKEYLEYAKEDFSRGRYATAILHVELSAQKAVKALITVLGFEPVKLIGLQSY
ncbi:MAG: HEPN domain-containing protein [Candidatus Bathyarchaeota archaeon]|nr:HEPN domain-containing protein [Candidatus Bathyarchaeota archaeon]